MIRCRILENIGDLCWDRVINRNSVCLGMFGWFRVIFVWEVHGLQLFLLEVCS